MIGFCTQSAIQQQGGMNGYARSVARQAMASDPERSDDQLLVLVRDLGQVGELAAVEVRRVNVPACRGALLAAQAGMWMPHRWLSILAPARVRTARTTS